MWCVGGSVKVVNFCESVAIFKLDKFSHFGCFWAKKTTLFRILFVVYQSPVKNHWTQWKTESYTTIVVAKMLFINWLVILWFSFGPKLWRGVLLAVSPRVWGDNFIATLCIIRNMWSTGLILLKYNKKNKFVLLNQLLFVFIDSSHVNKDPCFASLRIGF